MKEVDKSIDLGGIQRKVAIQHQFESFTKQPLVNLIDKSRFAGEARAKVEIIIIKIDDTAARQKGIEPFENGSTRSVIIAVKPNQNGQVRFKGGEDFIRQCFFKITLVNTVVVVSPMAVFLKFLISASELSLDPVIICNDILVFCINGCRHSLEGIKSVNNDSFVHAEILCGIKHFRKGIPVGRAKLENGKVSCIRAFEFLEDLVNVIHTIETPKA